MPEDSSPSLGDACDTLPLARRRLTHRVAPTLATPQMHKFCRTPPPWMGKGAQRPLKPVLAIAALCPPCARAQAQATARRLFRRRQYACICAGAFRVWPRTLQDFIRFLPFWIAFWARAIKKIFACHVAIIAPPIEHLNAGNCLRVRQKPSNDIRSLQKPNLAIRITERVRTKIS